jgi:hypothetical protein
LQETCASESYVLFSQHAEQFEVVRIKHDGEVAGSHLGTVRAARRHGEAKTPPVLCGLVEIRDHDDGVIHPDDVVERHSFVSPAGIGILVPGIRAE